MTNGNGDYGDYGEPADAANRLVRLLEQPEVAAIVRAAISVWIRESKPTTQVEHNLPVFFYDDPRDGVVYRWGVTGLRNNGVTGWFEVAGGLGAAVKPGSWRIDWRGRVHRGLNWQRVLAARVPTPATMTYAKALRALVFAHPGSSEWAKAHSDAAELLNAERHVEDENLEST